MKSAERDRVTQALALAALVLLIASGIYLTRQLKKERALSGAVREATETLERLARRNPAPSAQNLRALRNEIGRVSGFLTNVEQHFTSAQWRGDIDDRSFRIRLDTTVSKLRSEARASGVAVSSDSWFGFASQKSAMSFPPDSLVPMTQQLGDIEAVCEVLFRAKIHALQSIKRVPAGSEKASDGSDLLNATAKTNGSTVVVPYEITFEGFSTELAAVLEGLARAPRGLIVTNVIVEPAAAEVSIYPSAPIPRRRLLPARYDGPGVARSPAPVRPRSAPGSDPAVVLQEQQLRFILAVDAIRPRPDSPAAMAGR